MKVLAIEMEKLWPFQKNFMAILAIFFNNLISPERPLDRFFSNFFRTCLKGSSFTWVAVKLRILGFFRLKTEKIVKKQRFWSFRPWKNQHFGVFSDVFWSKTCFYDKFKCIPWSRTWNTLKLCQICWFADLRGYYRQKSVFGQCATLG